MGKTELHFSAAELQTNQKSQANNSFLSSITIELVFELPAAPCNLLPEGIAIDSLHYSQPLLLYWCHPGSILTCPIFSQWKEAKKQKTLNQTPALTPIPVQLPPSPSLTQTSWLNYFLTFHSFLNPLKSGFSPLRKGLSSVISNFQVTKSKGRFSDHILLASYSTWHSSNPLFLL